jgi:uncharacterized protein
MGIFAGLMAGIFEELGWTGFAMPTLLRLRYGVLGTGLIVGVLWGAWHLPINFWGSGVTAGELSPAVFASVWLIGILVGSLVAFRVLMVWVYECTGSLLVAILMHVSLTAFQYILTPPLGGTPYWIIGFATAAALWVIVAAVSLAQVGHLSRSLATATAPEAGGLTARLRCSAIFWVASLGLLRPKQRLAQRRGLP